MDQSPRHRRQRQRAVQRSRLLVAVAALAVIAFAATGFSSATFTSLSRAATGVVTASSDWTPPTVSVQNPGTSVRGSAPISATASDGESGIQSVVIQYQADQGMSWTTLCTDTAAPYSCPWATTGVEDGAYDLRAIATDGSGYTTTSDMVRTIVANSLVVTLSNVGDFLRGTVSMTTTIINPGLTVSSSSVQYSVAGTGVWRTACTNVLSSSCSWNTTNVNDGNYDLRSAVSVLAGGTYYSAVQTDVLVDNTAPAVTMTDPGTPLSGTRTFAATATDSGSGVAQVVIQYLPAGTSSWRVLCTTTVAPYSCRYDTTTLTDGTYAFRAVATDEAGASTNSTALTGRVVDNTVSSVSVEDPGAFLSGTATVTATASSTSGVTSVRIQRAVAGTTTWADICTDTTSPYSCAWDTRAVTDGSYDLRAILVDGSGRSTTSAVVSARQVDNSPVRGVDVQVANGTGTVGRLDAGDTVTYAYSEQVTPGSVVTGWTGSALPVTLRLRDGNALGLGNRGDSIDVLRNGAAVNLGSVNLKQDFVKTGKTASFNGTMTASTATVNGVVRTTVKVQLGSLAGGGGLRNVTTTAAMVWTPSTAATDLNGNKCSAAPVTESGSLDRDF